ncbi:MAG TPA: LysE family translocator [Microlunatus sp.]|nr:LysE family translocator [Microlunatus sp.]
MDLDLLPFLAVTALVMAVPGPSVLYAVTQRLERGRTAGIAAVLGLETGLLLHVLAACLGVSALVAASPSLLTALRFAGAGYLVLLGLRQLGFRLRRPSTLRPGLPLPGPPPSAPVGSPVGWAPTTTKETVRLWPVYRAGLLVDLLNPKTVIFFLALLPQFVPGGALTASAAATMVICVVGLGLLFDGGYAAVAGGLQRRRGLSAVGRWGPSLAGGCFLALAAVTFLG